MHTIAKQILIVRLLPLFSVCVVMPLRSAHADTSPLATSYDKTVRPFLQQYCVKCHDTQQAEGDLDLSVLATMNDAVKESQRWELIAQKLESGKMPPKKAKVKPDNDARAQIAHWFRSAIDDQTLKHAGDPGIVLARRLNNDEYDNCIRDLTGIDMHPAKQFPVDPVNPAGFDNTGESLVMSSSLLNKYLQAAHEVANHLVLHVDGFTFAPFSMQAETDRDRYCVQRIIALYHAQDTDYADYFEAAWQFAHRAELGKPDISLNQIAADRKLSPKYLATIWDLLATQKHDVGPLVKLQAMWKALPAPKDGNAQTARGACEQMRDFVVKVRSKVEPRFLNLSLGKHIASEPLLIWKNVQYATHRMDFDRAQLQVEGETRPAPTTQPEPGAKDEFGPGPTPLVVNAPGDPDLAVPAGHREKSEKAFAQFCLVFPDRFYTEARGRRYFDTTHDTGRYLSAGYHNLFGYFRDDQPLYELMLSDDQKKQLDAMWDDLDFVDSSTIRMYREFRAAEVEGGEERLALSETAGDVTGEANIKAREQIYLERAKDPKAVDAVKLFFQFVNDRIRWTEKARNDAEPSHLRDLLKFAEKAYRRPLADAERDDILGYYKSCRASGLTHAEAINEGIVGVLMSPDFCYRLDRSSSQKGIHPLGEYELASRLSFFLWSSLPDDELLSHAVAGDLHQPAVITAQARRMLKDNRARALAMNFGGNWLDFKRFDEISTVDRDRFPTFTNDLRKAMYEEPIRYLADAFANDRSMLDLLYGSYTFVNAPLAKHYGMPVPAKADKWIRIDNADTVGRGGLLGMACFMTKNSPGLRTSPVKRGNWVVKNILGEKIPPPPPNVPQIPHDESKLDLPLRQVLARHRDDPNCASCHSRIDSFGLVYEGFGPIGERRDKDLAGRAIDASASFPDNVECAGVSGLRDYIKQHRQKDFTDNFTRKMLSYSLGRSLILPDELLIKDIAGRLEKSDYHLDALIDAIVTSPQFLNTRGSEK